MAADDPIKLGLVASFAKPGGNATGVSFLFSELGPKQLGLLRELVPTASRIGLLVNPDNANVEAVKAEVAQARRPSASRSPQSRPETAAGSRRRCDACQQSC